MNKVLVVLYPEYQEALWDFPFLPGQCMVEEEELEDGWLITIDLVDHSMTADQAKFLYTTPGVACYEVRKDG